jgi:hypothetical protein
MIRLIAVSAFALTIATAAQAMSPVPLHHSNGMYTQARVYHGVAVRHNRRVVRRHVRRCAVWGPGHACARWHYVWVY